RFAASKAAVHGMVAPGIIALTEAVLRTMALGPIKVATSLALAVAIIATVAGLGTQPDTRVFSAPEPAQLQHAEAPPPGNPPAGALAGPPTLSPVMAARFELALTVFDVLFTSNRRGEAEIVQHDQGRGPRPETGPARGALLFAKEWVPNDPMSHGG